MIVIVWWVLLAIAAVTGFFWGGLLRTGGQKFWLYVAAHFATYWATIVLDFPLHYYPAAGIGIALSVFNIWNIWRRRKDRRRAARSLGAKSRARLAAVVAKARDAARGARPVLRPALEPA